MNKLLFGATLFLSSVMSINSFAAFTLNGTRFIYDEGKKNIAIEVTNNSEKTYGGQVWVDNETNANDVFFTPAPNLFKVDGGEKQLIRILYINDVLPKDKESLFWLNVQEIPPAANNDDGNVLAVALNTQVKLIYRPKLLASEREGAEKKVTYNGSVLRNPTPFYFAISQVAVNGIPLKLKKEVMQNISLLAPHSQVDLQQTLSGKVTVEAIDDYGARRIYDIK